MKESLNAAHVAKRRALLKAGDNQAYEKEIAEFMVGLRTKTMGMQKYAFTKLNFEEQKWPQNAQYFNSNL